MIEKQKKFPTIFDLSYNSYIRIIGDKVFLVASRDLKQGEEIFFNYSYDYWKFFYDLYKEHKTSFFGVWFTEKQRAL